MTDVRFHALKRFAEVLDSGIRVPRTSWRFGLDPILGLIPGFGDVAGAVLAGWVFVEAVRLGASRATLLRIAGNVALDATAGALPVVGDVFDFAWKANLRNVALLERHLAAPAGARRADRTFIVLLAAGTLAVGAGLLALGSLFTIWLVRAVTP